jgi:hypothetical protein
VRDCVSVQVLEKEFEVALADLSKSEMDVREKRLAVATYAFYRFLHRIIVTFIQIRAEAGRSQAAVDRERDEADGAQEERRQREREGGTVAVVAFMIRMHNMKPVLGSQVSQRRSRFKAQEA